MSLFQRLTYKENLSNVLPLQTLPNHLFAVSSHTCMVLNCANSIFNALLPHFSPCSSADKLIQRSIQKNTASILSPKLISHQHVMSSAAFETQSIDTESDQCYNINSLFLVLPRLSWRSLLLRSLSMSCCEENMAACRLQAGQAATKLIKWAILYAGKITLKDRD